jgi:hypothetical protein
LADDGLPKERLRQIFQAFTEMTVDMKDFVVDVAVKLPTWAIHAADRISEDVCLQYTSLGMHVGEAHSVSGQQIAHFQCKVTPGQGRSNLPAACNCHRIRPATQSQPIAIAA